MALVENKLDRSVPFFRSFTPYTPPTGTEVVSNLEKMISVNYIEPTRPVIINHAYGIEETFSFTVEVKNITTNVELDLQVNVNSIFKVSTSSFTLSPGLVKNIVVSTNNEYVNSLINKSPYAANFQLVVKNSTNRLGFVENSVSRLTKVEFPDQVSLIQ